MIYLDNAATSFPKPEAVYQALDRFARRSLANPGRAGHKMALAAERALELHPENAGPAHRGALALAHMGRFDEAREWVKRAQLIDPDDIVAQYNVACVHALIGECDQALDILEALLPQSSCYQILWFSNDSDLDAVRGHPRFQAMLDAIAACTFHQDGFRVASE